MKCLTGNLFVIVVTMLLVCPPPSSANQQKSYQQQIDLIGEKISRISKNLNANKALLKTEREKLLETEQKLVQTRKKIRATNDLIEQHRQQAEELRLQHNMVIEESADERQALARLLKQRYIHGREDYLKMLLNQQDPYAVGRLQNYYTYFTRAVQEKQARLQAQQQQLAQLDQASRVQLQELQKRKQELNQQQSELSRHKQSRDQSINKLKMKVAKSSEQLSQLQQDRDRLNRLLKEIAAQAAELARIERERAAQQAAAAAKTKQTQTVKPPRRALLAGGFARQKGRLQAPVQGHQKYRYGSRLAESGMLAEGVFIDTNGSVPVRSVYKGRVLFADFLKGYGLMLIIDHGDNHISLYGHNELLYKKVGDMVETNETVAKTGVSGGLLSHGLYFEIRENTTPVDPAKWCQF